MIKMTTASLIDGSFYDWMYEHNDYGGCYKPEGLEQWAVDTNRYFVHYVAGVHALTADAKILDLGSGIGHFVKAWKDCGFWNISGIEISKVACGKAVTEGIVHGTITDMHMFEDGQFDLVFSASVLEHIPNSVLDDALREMFRVGKRQAHLIGIELGTDPTHVTILKPATWIERFSAMTEQANLLVTEPIFKESPVVFSVEGQHASRPFRKMFHDIKQGVK